MKLYDINKAIQGISECVDEDGFLYQEAEKAINELKMERKEKFENIGALYKNLLADVDALKQAKKDISLKQKIAQNKADRIKKFSQGMLEQGNLDSYSAGIFKFSFRRSNSVNVSDIDKIPEEYLRIKKEANKSEIEKALKNGIEIEGAFIESSKNVQIK